MSIPTLVCNGWQRYLIFELLSAPYLFSDNCRFPANESREFCLNEFVNSDIHLTIEIWELSLKY